MGLQKWDKRSRTSQGIRDHFISGQEEIWD